MNDELEKYLMTYTKWVGSATTRVVKDHADKAMEEFLHNQPHGTQEGAARAYWVRYGYEIYRNLLFKQATLDDLNKLKEQSEDYITYGAQQMINDDLFITEETGNE